jgi:hypothetical protein
MSRLRPREVLQQVIEALAVVRVGTGVRVDIELGDLRAAKK